MPHPLHDGGAIGIFNITKHLSLRGHTVQMVVLSADDVKIPDELKKVCNVTVVPSRRGQGHSYNTIMRSWFSHMPYTIYKYQDNAFYDVIARQVSKVEYDIVHADHLAMAPYAVFLKEKMGLPIVLREHNMETIFLERMSKSKKNSVVGLYGQIEAQRMRAYEPTICEAFDACAMITTEDEDRLKALSSKVHTVVIPAGVDIPEAFVETPNGSNEILFLASLDWKPNQEGFMWFYNNVLPAVIQKIPGISVTIVGKGENNPFQFLSHPNIRYIGFVEDLQPYIHRAQLCIVPLFVASGMRIKILELMAHRKAIVSTSIASEGIDAMNDRELLIANTADEFVHSIIRLSTNKKERERIGNAAFTLVASRYSWSYVVECFENLYYQILKM